MYDLTIRKCTSPPLLAPRLKIYYPTRDRTPDLLNQRQTCYYLSQHGELEFEREKFYPGPGLEPGSLAFNANALPTELSRTSTCPR